VTSPDESRETAGTRELAGQAIALLTAAGQTVAVAESLTGGLLAAALTSIPGASAAFRGGVVAYAADLKASLLGVPSGLLDRHGAVHPEVAVAMASGVRHRLDASVAAATTGVAGPDPADGRRVGTVYIAACTAATASWQQLALAGSRAQIRAASVEYALRLLVGMLREEEL
jgi:nicotinamide-nucleotide amidase